MGSIAQSGSAAPARWRISVDDFHRMAEAGIFGPEDRVELLDGELVAMAPIGSRHAAAVRRLNRILVKGAMDRAVVAVQDPLTLAERIEVYPDLALLRPRADFYAGAHPRPGDVLLLVEVSDTTLRYDRDTKLPLYAAAGIAEVWIVDVTQRELLVFREPRGDLYADAQTLGADRHLSPTALPEIRLSVGELFD